LDATIQEDNLQYVQDLGLIPTRLQVAVANSVYREVIPHALTWTTQILILGVPAAHRQQG